MVKAYLTYYIIIKDRPIKGDDIHGGLLALRQPARIH
jgi:hypothetical protein